jgi:tetratricopeptide (TPR) repeat protein
MRKRVIFNWALVGIIVGIIVVIIAVVAPARFYVVKGEIYLRRARYQEAEKAFERAMSLNNDSCASCGLGAVYWKTGRYQDAEAAFKRSIALNPNDVCGYDWSGKMYYEQRKYAEAIEVFKQVVKLSPNVNSYLFLGNSFTYAERYAEAIEAYQQAIRLQPDSVTAYTEMGVAYEGLKRYREAIAAYQQALKLNQKEGTAHYRLARAYLAIGDHRAAAKQSEIAEAFGKRRVYFVPLGKFSMPLMRELESYYKIRLGIGIVALPAIPLDSLEASTFDARRRQFIAEELVELIKRHNPKVAQNPNAILIGLTDEDIYTRERNWQYAFSWWMDSRFAVVSSARMNPATLGQPANPELLNARFRKMVLKDIGILYYEMSPSDNPKSALFNKIEGVADLDAMGEEF